MIYTFQVWVNDVTPKIIFETPFQDRAEEFCETSKSEGFDVFVTRSEENIPNFYKRI